MLGSRLMYQIRWRRVIAVIIVGVVVIIPFPDWWLLSPFTGVILGLILDRSAKWTLVTKYRDEFHVYYLNKIQNKDLWEDLSTYSQVEYVEHPVISGAEEQIKASKSLESLFENRFLILGPPGGGKSTAIIRLVDCLSDVFHKHLGQRASLRSPFHPRLVVLGKQLRDFLDHGGRLPMFSAPTILVLDDLHELDEGQIEKLPGLLESFSAINDRKVIVICACRLYAKSRLPERIACFTQLDVSTDELSEKDSREFYDRLIEESSKIDKPEIKISDDVREQLISHMIENQLPPLYIVALFKELRREGKNSLSLADVRRIPKTLREIYLNHWNQLSESQKAFLRTIKILKKLLFQIDTKYVKTILKMLFTDKHWDRDINYLRGSIWFDKSEDGPIISPDTPYDVIPLPDIDDKIDGIFERVVEREPDKMPKELLSLPRLGRFIFLLGYYFGESRGDHERALKCSTRATELTPKDALSWYNLGVTRKRLDLDEKAVEAFQRATKIKPVFAEAWYNLGVTLHNLKKYEEAVEANRRAVAIDKELAEAWYNLGVTLGVLGRDEEAVEKFRRATEIKPVFAEAWYNLGLSLGKLGRDEEAVEANRRAVAIDKENAEAWYILGVSLFNLKKDEEALDAFQRATEINPEFAAAWCSIGMTLQAQGLLEEALEAKDKSRELGYQCP